MQKLENSNGFFFLIAENSANLPLGSSIFPGLCLARLLMQRVLMNETYSKSHHWIQYIKMQHSHVCVFVHNTHKFFSKREKKMYSMKKSRRNIRHSVCFASDIIIWGIWLLISATYSDLFTQEVTFGNIVEGNLNIALPHQNNLIHLK